MHRSGTSAATRLVNLLGLHTCLPDDLLGPMRGNPTGLWESDSLVQRNDELLDRLGRAWWCPPAADTLARAEARGTLPDPVEAGAAFRAVHPDAPWVWKDPRAALVLPYWRRAIGAPVAAIVMLRDPVAVATSLLRRDQFPIELGVALWERYNRLLAAGAAGLPLWLSTYDDLVEDPVSWSAAARSFLAGLQLPVTATVPTGAVGEYVRAELRHATADGERTTRDFPSAATVHRSLLGCTGVHASFTPPALGDESTWVEAELVAIGHHQVRPLPDPLRPTVSVIVPVPAEQVGPVAAGLTATLPSFCELLLLDTDGSSGAGAEGEGPVPGVRIVRAAGPPLGAALNIALGAASAGIVVVCAADTMLPADWLARLRRALAAGWVAAGPPFKTQEGGTGAGLTWVDRWLNLGWLAPSGRALSPVPFVPARCFGADRATLLAVGGFDPALRTAQVATTELCLRLWRLGHRCAATDGPPATFSGPVGAAPSDPSADDLVADLVRLAGVHLVGAGLDAVTEALRDQPGFAAAPAARGHDEADRQHSLTVGGAAPVAALRTDLGLEPRSVAAVVDEAVADGEPADRPTVSAIVISRNEGAFLGRTVDSLLAGLAEDDEVLVVDDGSSDGSTEGLDGAHGGRVRVLRADEHLGVARARALGAAHAGGQVLCFSDAHVDARPGWLAPLLAAACHPRVGAAGPALFPLRRPGILAGGLTYNEKDWGVRWLMDPEGVQPVPAICGCFLLIRRNLYEQMGGFDPAMGTYGSEDLELCLRLWRAGYQCVTVGQARVGHRFRYDERTDLDPADHLYGSLRFLSTHLEARDLGPYVGTIRTDARFAPAAARLLTTDVGARRLATNRRSVASARGALAPLCPEAFAESPPRRPGPGHALVFVGGLHRSGTSLVASLLTAHPAASGFSGTGVPEDEGQHLQVVYPTARAFGGPGRFALAEEAHLTESSALSTDASRDALLASWTPHWDLRRRVLVEKSPPNLIRSRFLQALFPGARFVMVQRHPVAVALSTRRWAPELTVESLLEHWFFAWEVFGADRPHLEHVHVVRYEALVADPAGVTAALGDFVGLDGLEAVPVDAAASELMAAQWEDLMARRGPGWLEELCGRFGAAAAALGYDLGDPVAERAGADPLRSSGPTGSR